MITASSELPKGWVWTVLDEIALAINPGFPSGKWEKASEQGVPHLRPMNINENGAINLTEIKYVKPQRNEPLSKGDIIFNNTNSPKWVGKTTYIKEDTNWAFSNHMTRIKVHSLVKPGFISYYLHHLFLKGFFLSNCLHHVNQASINTTFLKDKVPIPLAPTNEQLRIVGKVEELFSFLDAGVDSLHAVQAQLKRYRRTILKAAFEGKLTEQWRLAQEFEASKAKIVSGTRGIPPSWIKTSIGNVCQLVNGRAFKPTEWASTGLAIIRIQNLNDIRAPFNFCNFTVDEKYYVNDGDLLFAWSGTPETSFGAHIWNRGKAVLNQHIFNVKIDEKLVNKLFFKHLLNWHVNEYIAKAHGTAGLAHITKGKFESSQILLPPILEQMLIAQEIENNFSVVEENKKIVDDSTNRSEYLRQSILKSAFEGKLMPQDPSDEPAEQLLARIKADRLAGKSNNNKVELSKYVK